MAVAVPMKNVATHAVANGYRGFSWTVLFFGAFPALFRGHIAAFFVMIIAALFTFGLSWLVFPFAYNSWHFNWLTNKGFSPIGLILESTQAPVINVSVGNVSAHHSDVSSYAEDNRTQIAGLPDNARPADVAPQTASTHAPPQISPETRPLAPADTKAIEAN